MVVDRWPTVDGRQLMVVAVVSGRRWLIVVAGWRSSLVGGRRWSSLVVAGWLVVVAGWLVVVAGWLVVVAGW